MSKREIGEKILNKKMDTYGDSTIAELESGSWRRKRKSYLIKWLMNEKEDLTREKLGELFGSSRDAVSQKLSRDSFTIDELIIAAHAAGYDLALRNRETERLKLIRALEWFKDYDDVVYERLKNLVPQSVKIIKRSEYEMKKKELEALKAEYGFED